jgi:hypothetical protein
MFDIDAVSLPNVIFYKPKAGRFAPMIGAFNSQTILDHQNRFIDGKIVSVPVRMRPEIKEMDCAA